MSYQDLMLGSEWLTWENVDMVLNGLLALFFWFAFISFFLAVIETLIHVDVIGFHKEALRGGPFREVPLVAAVYLSFAIIFSVNVWRRL